MERHLDDHRHKGNKPSTMANVAHAAIVLDDFLKRDLARASKHDLPTRRQLDVDPVIARGAWATAAVRVGSPPSFGMRFDMVAKRRWRSCAP